MKLVANKMKKKIVSKTKDGYAAKDILMFKNPNEMKAILHDIRWTILQKLAKEPKFPADLAREMGLHEQKIYYHIRQLIEAGLVTIAFEKEIRGAKARYYKTTEKAYGIELSSQDAGLHFNSQTTIDETLQKFFKELLVLRTLMVHIRLGLEMVIMQFIWLCLWDNFS